MPHLDSGVDIYIFSELDYGYLGKFVSGIHKFHFKWQDKYINVSTYSYDKVLVSHYPLIQDSKL